MKDFRVFHTTLMLAAILAGTPLVTSPSLAGEEKRLDLASLIAELTEPRDEGGARAVGGSQSRGAPGANAA
jgi:hypothetical protein